MADIGIKKTRIKQSDLPSIDVNAEGYVLRYRIISEDKNRMSHWSPVEILKPEYTFEVGNIDHTKTGNITTVAWNAVKIKKNNTLIRTATTYDIWVKWDRGDNGDWEYRSRVDSSSISLLHPTTYSINGVEQPSAPNKLSIEIYLKGNPITRDSTFLKVYTGGPWTI